MGKYRKLFHLKKACGVYQLMIGRKTYIGSSANIFDRLIKHASHLRRNTHQNKKLQLAFNKNKKIKYRVLKFCEVNELSMIEQFYVNKYNPILNNRNKIAQSRTEYKSHYKQ